jgi:hypothetical protein
MKKYYTCVEHARLADAPAFQASEQTIAFSIRLVYLNATSDIFH